MSRSLSTLPNLEVFCATYETNSFTRAAERLALTPQATSRAVARLEAALGVALFRRTTRSLAPTEAGRRYYESCRVALGLLDDAERELAQGQRAPKGEVHVSLPTTYGLHRFLPSMGRFRLQHPGIEVVSHLSSRNVDFVRDGIDLAIRMGAIADQSLVRRPLGDYPLGLFASPRYLAQRAAPVSVDDLERHLGIAFVLPSSGRMLAWPLFADGERRQIAPPNPYRVSGDPLGAIALAIAGAGIVQTYRFLVERELLRGELVEVLPESRGAARPFSLVYPARAIRSRAVRAVVDFVIAEAATTLRDRS